jgi:hypothetical protein
MKEGEIKVRIRIKIRRRGKEDEMERDERDQNEWREAGDGKASAFAKAMADSPESAAWRIVPGDERIRAHAQELITFPRGEKSDWGKNPLFLKIYFSDRF